MNKYCKTDLSVFLQQGLPKWAKWPIGGHDRYSGGHEQQRGQRGPWAVKEPQGGHEVII